MNILFVNYGDFTTNSLNHIGGFANRLCVLGHAAMVAVPANLESVRVIPAPLFIPALQQDLLEGKVCFPDGRDADVIHAWTPRERVRAFVSAYRRRIRGPVRLIVHLEDNEEQLLCSFTRRTALELEGLDAAALDRVVPDALSHPFRHRTFLTLADGVTVIVPRLREHVPEGVPVHLLEPGLDPGLPWAWDAVRKPGSETVATLRPELGLARGERVLVFTGSNTFANEADMRDLYVAIRLLNEGGIPTRLVRTGFNRPEFLAGLSEDLKRHVLDLGFVAKERLPGLLALADALVQPGRPGPFNDYRLPSKLPEFLASGRPVVLPRSNIALDLSHGADALILNDGGPGEIAAACRRLFGDPNLSRSLGTAGAAFARRRFDLAANTDGLLRFYTRLPADSPAVDAWRFIGDTAATDLTAAAARLAASLTAAASRPDAAPGGSPSVGPSPGDLGLPALALLATAVARLMRDQEARADAVAGAQARGAAEAATLSAQLTSLRTVLRDARAQRVLAARHLRNLETRLAATERAARQETEKAWAEHAKVAARVGELDAELTAQAARIRGMTGSLSWRATAPVRDLQRLLSGKAPASGSAAAASPAPGSSAAGSGPSGSPVSGSPLPTSTGGLGSLAPSGGGSSRYTLAIDRPRTWTTTAPVLTVVGWCLENAGQELLELRATLGGRTVTAEFGLRRPDVATRRPDHPQSPACGFRLNLPTEAGERALVIEARDQAGWSEILRTTLHTGAAGDTNDCQTHEAWVARNDTLSEEDCRAIQAHVARMSGAPRISVLMPVFNPPPDVLDKAIQSVRQQLYPHWELCLADDASTDPRIRLLIEGHAAADRRIRVSFRETNGHICAASNTALGLASGGHVALLDHDDLLAPTALYEVAAALLARPRTRFIYSDEDKIGADERRYDPYFKPDWNPDLLLGQAYTCHLSVFETTLVRAIGGFRPGTEGSQDWDLTLRVVERLSAAEIHHIPRILYHWRAVPGSTAAAPEAKAYAAAAARRALEDHLVRTGQSAEVMPVSGGHWRICWRLPPIPPKVTLIIPTRNGVGMLRRAVTSLVELTAYSDFEILIVDNESDDPATLDYLRELTAREADRIRVVPHPHPFNYSALNNRAAELARGEVLGFLNNDVEAINADWLTEMVSQALRPGVGAVGALLYYPAGTVQHAGVILGLGGVAGHAFKEFPRGDPGYKNRLRLVQNTSAVTAACLVVRKDRFLEVGGFDQRNLAVAFNDVDLCCKLVTAGHRTVWTPFAEFFHHESATRGTEDTPEKRARFEGENAHMIATWGELLAADPAYNPNLSLVSEDFTPALVSRAVPAWR